MRREYYRKNCVHHGGLKPNSNYSITATKKKKKTREIIKTIITENVEQRIRDF